MVINLKGKNLSLEERVVMLDVFLNNILIYLFSFYEDTKAIIKDIVKL